MTDTWRWGVADEPESRTSPEEEALLRAAAERGDAFASWRLGRALLRMDSCAQEAQHWLRVAADAGQQDARMVLAWLDAGRKYCSSDTRPEIDWWFRNIGASWNRFSNVVVFPARWMPEEEDLENSLLRDLVAVGDAQSARYLAISASRSGDHEAEAEWWARAAELGDEVSALMQGRALEKLGKFEEAEAVYHRAAARGEPSAQYQLREILRRQGKPVPEHLRSIEDPPPVQRSGTTQTVVVTAIITTAVVPFVQALASKAAEHAYETARTLTRRLLLREDRAAAPPSGGPVIYVLEDSQSGTRFELRSGRLSDEALLGLTLVDLEALAAPDPSGRTVTIRWEDSVGVWRRHVQDNRSRTTG
ncbi:hypothetical protein [Streptomyces sp. NPDC001020]